MFKTIGVCGLACYGCKAFLAGSRPEAACGGEEPGEVKVSCCGCGSDDHMVTGICRNCDIRFCAKKMGLTSCAVCEKYPCGKLLVIFEDFPEARKNLDETREMSP